MATDDTEAMARKILEGMEGVTPGPWKAENTYIFAPNSKIGGDEMLAEIRGWGYLTGRGHGALGLPHEHAAAIQNRNAAYIARCSPATLRPILEDYIRVKEELKNAKTVTQVFADGGRRAGKQASFSVGWNAALEEAAKVAVGHDDGTSGKSLRYNLACQRIATAIRSLKR